MKSHFFHLMPYKHLPADFAARYRSVWVDVPSHLYDPVKGHAIYNEYLDELEHADQAGFDGLCVNEHHSNAYGLMPSPNLMLAALTRRAPRRCGFPAPAASRRGSGWRATTTATRSCPTAASSPPCTTCRVTGKPWSASARTAIRIALGTCSWSRSPSRTREPRPSTRTLRPTSITAACTCPITSSRRRVT